MKRNQNLISEQSSRKIKASLLFETYTQLNSYYRNYQYRFQPEPYTQDRNRDWMWNELMKRKGNGKNHGHFV